MVKSTVSLSLCTDEFSRCTRQHPQGGGREALSNPFSFLFIINIQYEYNWIILRQLTYLSEIPKMDQNWDPSAGYFSS